MECRVMQPDLIAYYLGALESPRRAALEAHLTECRHCMKNFVFVKRDFEIESDDVVRPSQKMKVALRDDIEKTFGRSKWGQLLEAMRQPRPLSQLVPASLAVAFIIAWVIHLSPGVPFGPASSVARTGNGATSSSAEISTSSHLPSALRSSLPSSLPSIDTSGASSENVNFL